MLSELLASQAPPGEGRMASSALNGHIQASRAGSPCPFKDSMCLLASLFLLKPHCSWQLMQHPMELSVVPPGVSPNLKPCNIAHIHHLTHLSLNAHHKMYEQSPPEQSHY